MSQPVRSPRLRRRRDYRALRNNVLAWVLGLVLLALAFLWLMSGLPWYTKLAGWIVLAFVADECGGWFGYVTAILGALPFFSGVLGYGPDAPAQWNSVYPLVLVGLLAALLVKHSGGAWLLPVSVALLVAPILVARHFGADLDSSVTLPGIPRFFDTTLMAGVVGAAFGVLVALIRWWWRRRRASQVTARS